MINEEDNDYDLPIKETQIQDVYNHIKAFKNNEILFEARDEGDGTADVYDLIQLLEKLADHYTQGPNGEKLELGTDNKESLVDIFDTLFLFYAQDISV